MFKFVSLAMMLSLLHINGSLLFINNTERLDAPKINFEFAEGIDADAYGNNLDSSSDINNSYTIKLFFKEVSTTLNQTRQIMQPTFGDNLEEYQNRLLEYRQEIGSKNYEDNLVRLTNLKNNIDLPDTDIFISKYSPMISFSVDEFSTIDSFLIDLMDSANVYHSLDEVYVCEEPSLDMTLDISMDQAKSYINLDSDFSIFDGNGVNVGIIDAGVLNVDKFSGTLETNNDYYGRNIVKMDGHSVLSDHSDNVAMIAVGNNGIAKGANILSASANQASTESCIEWMLDQGANVVNASYSYYSDTNNGAYTSLSKYIDSIVKDAMFVFVGSSGNQRKENPNNEIGSPKSAYNCIAVGNTSASKNYITDSSSYVEDADNHVSKPNIVAPGYIQTNSYDRRTMGGTSFSTPLVTGCIALLMEEFPYLVAYPELVTSVITSSASPMSSTYNNESGDNHYDGSGLHNQIGAGLLNYEKMREAANQYLSITRPKNSSAGIIPQYIDIVATDEQRIRASSAWLYDEDTFTDYDLELYKLDVDGTMDKVAYIDDPYNNVEFIDFNVQTTGTYRLVVNQKEQNTANDFIGLSYVLIDNEGGSTSGASNIDDTLNSHFEIDRSIYEDYGDTYNNEAITETEINDGIHIYETTRKRARYTDDGKLVLSAKSNDSNYAYMEYKFDITDPINDDWGLYNIKYQFGLWSDDESLIRNSSIDLYGLHHGSWFLIRHFDPKEMSTDPNNLKTYIDCLDFPVNGLRFYVKTNYTNNDNNVGRVVIGNIEGDIHYHLYTKYEQYNDNYHKVVCGCGDYHLESHTWGPSYSSGIYEYANCTKCDEQHNMTSGGPIVTPIV